MAFVAYANFLGFSIVIYYIFPVCFGVFNACCLQLLFVAFCPGDHLSPSFSQCFFLPLYPSQSCWKAPWHPSSFCTLPLLLVHLLTAYLVKLLFHLLLVLWLSCSSLSCLAKLIELQVICSQDPLLFIACLTYIWAPLFTPLVFNDSLIHRPCRLVHFNLYQRGQHLKKTMVPPQSLTQAFSTTNRL